MTSCDRVRRRAVIGHHTVEASCRMRLSGAALRRIRSPIAAAGAGTGAAGGGGGVTT